MSPQEQILEYVRLRKFYHEKVKKTAPKQDRPYIDAIVRELRVVEKFALAASYQQDTVTLERMKADMLRYLDITDETLKL